MIQDLLTFGGLAMAGVGLWLYAPWISFTVVGFLLFGIGIFPSVKK
jgi:hypothetical protein